MTEVIRVVRRFEPFVLGRCRCGCDQDIEIITKEKILRKFIHHHHAVTKYNPNWQGGKATSSDGYFIIKKPDHPFCDSQGYVKEHRLIIEKHLGRYLTQDEHVHHINENKKDNRIENLEVMTNSQHRIFHQTKDLNGRICLLCNSTKTYITKHNNRPHWFKYKNGYICNKCRMINYHKSH